MLKLVLELSSPIRFEKNHTNSWADSEMYSRVYMKLLYYLTIYMYNRVRLERLAVVVSVISFV